MIGHLGVLSSQAIVRFVRIRNDRCLLMLLPFLKRSRFLYKRIAKVPTVYYKLKIPENIKKISLVISAGIPWKNQGQLKTASW